MDVMSMFFAIETLPDADTRAQLEERLCDALGVPGVLKGERLDFHQKPKIDFEKLRAFSRELSELVPDYKPQIQ